MCAAGAGSEMSAAADPGGSELDKWHDRAYWVALRLVAIEKWHDEHSLVPLRAPPDEIGEVVRVEQDQRRTAANDKVLAQGHELFVSQGRLHCAKCRRSSRMTSMGWTALECSAEQRASTSFPQLKRTTNQDMTALLRAVGEGPETDPVGRSGWGLLHVEPAEAVEAARRGICRTAYRRPEEQAVTAAVFAKCRQQRAGDAKRRKVLNGYVDGTVWDSWARALPSAVANRLHAHTDARHGPAFGAHHSHTLLMCGGFAGCCACGSVTGFTASRVLLAPCRGFCPRGSAWPIRRLAQGKLPREREDSGLTWPDGSSSPLPYRWRGGGAGAGDADLVPAPEVEAAAAAAAGPIGT